MKVFNTDDYKNLVEDFLAVEDYYENTALPRVKARTELVRLLLWDRIRDLKNLGWGPFRKEPGQGGSSQ